MTPMRWRKKPVVIEAFPATDAVRCAGKDWTGLPQWLRDAYDAGGVVFTPDGVHLPTPEGSMLAARGDWIIRGVEGELYPCKPRIFEATYEAVE